MDETVDSAQCQAVASRSGCGVQASRRKWFGQIATEVHTDALTGRIVGPFLQQRALGEGNDPALYLYGAAAQIKFNAVVAIAEKCDPCLHED